MTLGEKIQELRRKNAMSQDVLAEKLEISRQAVSKWERDEAIPETDKIIRIAQLFRVSTDYLLMQESEQSTVREEATYQTRAQQNQTVSHTINTQRLERFIRRHGYKGGFVLAGIGMVMDLIALLFRGIWRSSVSNMMGSFDSSVDSMFGNSGIPGFGMGDGMLEGFQQGTQQMGNAASSWGDIFLILMIPGTIMILLGSYIIYKGKKIAREAERK